MAHPFPLQRADVAPDYSTYDSSEVGDRRRDVPAPITSPQEGVNAAPQHDRPQMLVWAPGSDAPEKHVAPFDRVEYHEYNSDRIVEIDRKCYGDAWDPRSPMRVREVGSEWTFDPDEDGEKA
jgi:hypothetical protein